GPVLGPRRAGHLVQAAGRGNLRLPGGRSFGPHRDPRRRADHVARRRGLGQRTAAAPLPSPRARVSSGRTDSDMSFFFSSRNPWNNSGRRTSKGVMPLAAPPPDTPPLPEDLAVCQQMIRELLASLHAAEQDNAHLRQRLDALLRRLYGPKAERLD